MVQKLSKTILILLITVILSIVVFVFFSLLIKKIYYIYYFNKYPLKYEEQIGKYSREFGLDSYLVAAVIYEESRFKVNSNSHKGAVGLMQVLPETGAYIAKKLNDAEYEEKNLAEADKNIRYGCYYLYYLKQKYDTLDKVLAAYNAGEGNVDYWTDGDKLDIKYKETTDFVEKVKKTKSEYEKLYEGTGRL